MSDIKDNGNDVCAEGSSRLLRDSAVYRNCSLTFNADLYTRRDEYDVNSPYIVNCDGDGRGRDPKNPEKINEAGTSSDIKNRDDMLAFNSNLYTCGNEYGAGTGNV